MTRSLFQGYRGTEVGENNLGRNKKQQEQDELMQHTTSSYLLSMEENSSFFGSDFQMEVSSRLIPSFSPDEVKLETMVGMGEYGTVTKVSAIHLTSNNDRNKNNSLYNVNTAWKHQNGDTGGDGSSTLHTEKPLEGEANHHPEQKPQQQQQQQQQRRKLFPSSNCIPTLAEEAKITEEPPKSWGAEVDIIVPNPQGNKITASQSIVLTQLASQAVPLDEGHDISLPSSQRLRLRSSVLSTDVLAMAGSKTEDSLRIRIAEEADSTSDFGASSRFALKQIRKDLYPKKRCEAAKDLAREAKFLARFSHPNIICLQGLVSQPGRPEFGILLDRLRITLSEEAAIWKYRQNEIVSSYRSTLVSPIEAFASNIASKWQFWQRNDKDDNSNRQSSTDFSNVSEPMSPQSSFRSQRYSQDAVCLMGERLLALHDVAQALEYLHDRKILFRDLKPENVAMLGKKRFQLFDFGLAKECKEVDRLTVGSNTTNDGLGTEGTQQNEEYNKGMVPPDHTTNGNCDDFYNVYKMTGLTGTLRIMAPETIQCLPYGLPADVFSFGICMWEVFTGHRLSLLTAGEIVRGDRPDPPPFDDQCGVGLPLDLSSFLQLCWDPDQYKRPTFNQVCKELAFQLNVLQQSKTTSSNNDDLTVDREGSFWYRLESFQEPVVFDRRGREAATLVQ